MLKKLSKNIFLFLCVFAYLLIPVNVYAHVLQTNGTIGAVMHVDPNDDPTSGQPATISFTFKDTADKFTPQNCDCHVKILENGSTIYAQPIFQNTQTPSTANASVIYTFPQPDVYQIVVTGAPITKNGFQSFTLTFAIRTEQPLSSSQPTPPVITFLTTYFGYIIAGSIIAILLIGKAILNYKDHKSIFPKS